MNRQRRLSPAVKRTVAALLVAAVGIVIQIVAGIDFPTVPPGLIILLVAAGLVAFGPWRWTGLFGAVVGLSQFVGLFLAGEADRLVDPSPFGGLVGLWIQWLAVMVAMVAGIVATTENYRTPSGPGSTSPGAAG